LPLDASKVHEDGDDSDGEDGEDSTKPKEPSKPARQPRGPKPAPQLKMCQSDDGPVLLKVTTASSKCEADDSSDVSTCSTVTTNVEEPPPLARKLSSVPSFPEAELWKCIKPSGACSPLATAALLDEWDSCSLLLNSTTAASKDGIDMAHDLGAGIFQGTCEMGAMPWSMDVEPAPESLFAPNPAGFYNREPAPHPSQDLQKLAALLDLI
jgi:myb proto-oncogene protein